MNCLNSTVLNRRQRDFFDHILSFWDEVPPRHHIRGRTKLTTFEGCRHRCAHFGEVDWCWLVQALVDQKNTYTHTHPELYCLLNSSQCSWSWKSAKCGLSGYDREQQQATANSVAVLVQQGFTICTYVQYLVLLSKTKHTQPSAGMHTQISVWLVVSKRRLLSVYGQRLPRTSAAAQTERFAWKRDRPSTDDRCLHMVIINSHQRPARF